VTTDALRRRLAEVERRLPSRATAGDDGGYDPALFDYLSIEELEELERHFEAALAAEEAGREDGLEAEAMVVAHFARAEHRRAAGWPARWWDHPDLER
jgi:hypothetical protein